MVRLAYIEPIFMELKQEKTFVLIKPDGVKRGLVGEVILRIERSGLKIVAIEMTCASVELINKHLPKEETWIARLGEKTLSTYEKYGLDAKKELGTDDKLTIGKMVRGWLIDYLSSAPILKMVLEGVHAIDMVRKIAGHTIPAFAERGTVRGDFSVDSAASANREKRAIYNLMHASETPAEAAHEIELWFGNAQICAYQRTDENLGINN